MYLIDQLNVNKNNEKQLKILLGAAKNQSPITIQVSSLTSNFHSEF